MDAPEQKITREELHHLVWTRTFVKLAKELGYNHPELSAICEDLNIPRPSGGYWNRLALGTAEAQEPLPPAPAGKPTEIPRGPRRASEEPAPEPSETAAPLNLPDKNEADASGKVEAKPDVTSEKQDIRSIQSSTNSTITPAPALDSTLQDQIRVTREDLYQQIWNKPLSKLAAELGTSYAELVRVCDELKVPRPERDHWNRLQYKLPVTVMPLPAPEPGMPNEGLIWRKGSRRQKPVDLADDHHSEPGQDAAVASVVAVAAQKNKLLEKPAVVEYSREQLHETIWSKPCVKLAAELGISDVGLSKTCRRMGIPRPPRGYWARVEAGDKPKREPLPPALPGQDNVAVFQVQQGQDLNLNPVQSAMHDCRCEAVELPPDGCELHPIAERHRKAIEKAKPDERGFVRVEGKNLFHCAISAALAPRLVRALHAILIELEDRDFDFRPGSNEYAGLKISRDEDEASLIWSEEMLEWDREPTEADKRKPSWTWQLKETKPAGKLNVEVKAYGVKGKRRWTEDDGRTLEEVLGVAVEKIEAIFRGYENQRLREAEWAKQREEDAKRAAEQRAIKAEQEAREEKVRKEREHIKRHEKKLEEIAEERSDNLASAAQEWIEMQGMLAYIHYCEERWRREGGGTLSKEQTDWLSWARAASEKMGPKGYPDPLRDGSFDASAVPVGGPYPETRKSERDEPEETEPPEVKSPEYQPPSPDPFPFWLMHRHR